MTVSLVSCPSIDYRNKFSADILISTSVFSSHNDTPGNF